MRFWSHWLPQTQQAVYTVMSTRNKAIWIQRGCLTHPGWSSGPHSQPRRCSLGKLWGEEALWAPREARHLPQRQDPHQMSVSRCFVLDTQPLRDLGLTLPQGWFARRIFPFFFFRLVLGLRGATYSFRNTWRV